MTMMKTMMAVLVEAEAEEEQGVVLKQGMVTGCVRLKDVGMSILHGEPNAIDAKQQNLGMIPYDRSSTIIPFSRMGTGSALCAET